MDTVFGLGNLETDSVAEEILFCTYLYFILFLLLIIQG